MADSTAATATTATTTTVDYDAVKCALTKAEVLLDVRSRDEVEELGQIHGAHCLPVKEMEWAFDLDAEAFSSKYGFPKPSADAPVTTHCMKGGRAQKAADIIAAKGYTAVKVYAGSYNDWVAKGGDIIKPGKPFRPQ